MKKRFITFALCAVVTFALLLSGCGSEPPFTDEQKTLQETLEDSIKLTWMGDVRNDTTKLWRLSECVTRDEITKYALDYYKAYFTSNDEVHAVVNFTLNTTNKISVVGDLLSVEVYEYVSGEEHDAAKLFGGSLLQSYLINIDSGEIQ